MLKHEMNFIDKYQSISIFIVSIKQAEPISKCNQRQVYTTKSIL